MKRRIDGGEAFDVAVLNPLERQVLCQRGELQTWIGFAGGAGTIARDPQAARDLLRSMTAPSAADMLRKAGVEPFVE